jgi:hypothetical protein
MKNKERLIILSDFEKILDLTYKYCKHDNRKICDAAQEINNTAYKTMKYIDRYLKAKKRKRTKKKK